MDGRLIDWRSSLLPATLNCLEDRHLTTLDPGRRRVPEAGAVIALNSFLPWEQHSGDLRLADLSSVDKLTFDARCPTGVRGTPPHLDMIAASVPRATRAPMRAEVVAACENNVQLRGILTRRSPCCC